MLAGAALGAGSASASSLPQPTGADGLADVSCTGVSNCWAVGSSQAPNSNVTGEILHWTGRAWGVVSTPAAAGALASVSCASSHSCWAVGGINTGGGSYPDPLLIRWDGSTWRRVAPPRLREASFVAVSCQAARNCWIVGTQARDRTLALHWNGARWKPAATSNPSRFSRALTAVTCVSAQDCWASGYYYGPPLKPTVTAYLLILHWNGTAWKKVWTSQPYYGGESSQSVSLNGLACPRGRCLAVGGDLDSLFYPKPLAVAWNGQRWDPLSTAPVRYAFLSAISCASRSSCFSVGQAGTVGGGGGPAPRGLAERWDGRRWKRTPVPAGSDSLTGVSCVKASDCWAVGQGGAGNVALRWNGHSWSAF